MQPKPNLDLLRSIAITLVVLDHFLLARGQLSFYLLGFTWSPGWLGVFGVYLFFVHTCLVLMWSLQRKPHTLDFYIRRVFRIYPLAIVAILILVLFRLPFSSNSSHLFTLYHPTPLGLLSNLLLIQNIAHGGGYVLAVMWSLPLEVQMYVLLPVLYFFVRKNFNLWPLLLIWLLSCGLAYHDVPQGNTFTTVIPCFIPGVIAYVSFARTRPVLPAWLFPFFLAILCTAFMHFMSPPAGWVACLALGLGLPYFHQIQLDALKRTTHALAKYSYSVYLSHMFALGICFASHQLPSLWLQILCPLLLTAVFSFLGYHLVEEPLIRLGARLAASVETRYEQHMALEGPVVP